MSGSVHTAFRTLEVPLSNGHGKLVQREITSEVPATKYWAKAPESELKQKV